MLVLRHGLRRKRLAGVWRRVFAGFKPKVLESPQTAFFQRQKNFNRILENVRDMLFVY